MIMNVLSFVTSYLRRKKNPISSFEMSEVCFKLHVGNVRFYFKYEISEFLARAALGALPYCAN